MIRINIFNKSKNSCNIVIANTKLHFYNIIYIYSNLDRHSYSYYSILNSKNKYLKLKITYELKNNSLKSINIKKIIIDKFKKSLSRGLSIMNNLKSYLTFTIYV